MRVMEPLTKASSNQATIPDRTALDVMASRVLERAFVQVCSQDAALSALMHALKRWGAKLAVFGGWPRDVLLASLGRPDLVPNDIDCVVSGLSREQLHELLPGETKMNAFAGFAVPACTPKLDIWRIEDTHTLVVRKQPFLLESLPTTTVFSDEAIIFKPGLFWGAPSTVTHRWYENMAFGQVDLGDGEICFPPFQIGRLLRHLERLRLGVTPRLEAFVRQVVAEDASAQIIEKGIRKYTASPWTEQALARVAELRSGDLSCLHRGEPCSLATSFRPLQER